MNVRVERDGLSAEEVDPEGGALCEYECVVCGELKQVPHEHAEKGVELGHKTKKARSFLRITQDGHHVTQCKLPFLCL